MRRFIYPCLLLFIPLAGFAQQTSYTISFKGAVHHEAQVTARFTGVRSDTLLVRMSRSSPGRYALHEFAKNVYGVQATDSKGKALDVFRPDPYSWKVTGHDGTVQVEYLLYGNRGDGTYVQIDETHAHLNMPATFLYAPAYAEKEFEVTFMPREDLHWKIATQLPLVSGTTYSAPNLPYFMDSPTEISDFASREFTAASNGKTYTFQFVLHQQAKDSLLDAYVTKVEKIVGEEQKVFGEFPDYDYGRYTFLACYMPQDSGDGMEHRNSTFLTDNINLPQGGITDNIGTVSHEFFHCWNVERLRPKSLEPFDFVKANMSGALWFAEGFTSYYTNLILCRAGIISTDEYISGLAGTFNYVWNSPARRFFNPIEMSYQAPFVDAATSIDPVNRENTFISYYSYGSVLGLALDLSLRQHGLSLDGFMRLLWNTYGKKELPYTVDDLHDMLSRYAGKGFGDDFFGRYIYESQMPDYEALFKSVGVQLSQDPEAPWLGVRLSTSEEGFPMVQGNTPIGSPAYEAGLEGGDLLLSVNGQSLGGGASLSRILAATHPGDSLQLSYRRRDMERTTALIVAPNPSYSIQLEEKGGNTPSGEMLEARQSWLHQE